MSDDRTFVSYSRSDSQFAVKLASDLRANGASVWLDQLDIAAGARWDSAIEDALRHSARVIVLLSPKAVASQNVLDEVSFALDEGRTIVPVLVEACAIPMRLRRLQYVDFTPGYDVALGRLLVTLGVARTTVSRAAPPAAEPPAEPSAPVREPEPSASYEPSFATHQTRAESDGARRRVWLSAAAFTAVVLIGVVLVFWRGGSTSPTPEPTAEDVQPTQTRLAPAGQPGGGGIGNGGLDLREDTDLPAFLAVVREFGKRTTLDTADLERLGDARYKACPFSVNPTPCSKQVDETLSSLLSTVCERGSRAKSEFAVVNLDCPVDYEIAMQRRQQEKLNERLKRIKPG